MNLQNRDSSIDAIKILAILLVIVHHLLDFGFTLSPSAPGPLRLVWHFSRTVAISCIDLFALATGFLCITSAGSHRRLFHLWLQAIFTGLAVSSLCILAGAAVAPFDWLRALFPVVTGEYWYFTAYVAVALLAPVLNPGIRALPKGAFARLLAVFFLLLSVPSVLFPSDPFVLKHGYSFAWLLVLYFFGAFWRLHIPSPPCIPLCLAAFLPAAFSFLLPSIGKRLFPPPLGTWFSDFNPVWPSSPFVLVIALALFGLSRHLRIHSLTLKRLLFSLSSLSFGMYLWLVHPVFWRAFWCPRLSSLVVSSLPGFAVAILLATACSFTASAILEWIRIALFRAANRILSRKHSQRP